MNIIGIDPSIKSTAMCINGKLFNFTTEQYMMNKKSMKKWYSIISHLVEYVVIDYKYSELEYSESELQKLHEYEVVAKKIISTINNNIDNSLKTIVNIEGYSYSSEVGDIVDLVTFSTLLRRELVKSGYNVNILSPSTLKLESCKMTYQPIDVGKKKPKLEFRNNEGISGGKFTKREMYKVISENNTWNDDWSMMIKSFSNEVLSSASIPKPIDDLNDAFLLYKKGKSQM